MRYWIFDGRDAQGPFTDDELRRQPSFSLDTLICPDGAATAEQWKPARQYLPARAPEPRPEPRPQPRPEPRPEPRSEPLVAEVKPESGRLRPEVVGESPEALRLRKALELPARRLDPEPPPVAPEPPAPVDHGPLLKKLGLAAGTLALVAAGFVGTRAVMKRRAKRPAAAAAAAASGSAAEAALPSTPAADAQPGGETAIDFVKSFALQSRSRKRPADAADVLAPKAWQPAPTLGRLYDQLGLEALALEAAASVERQGHTIAEGDKEIRRSPQLWAKRAARILEKTAPEWSAEPAAAGYRVTVRLPARPGEAPRRFDVDAAAGTLKPADQLSWFDVDPAQAARWGGKYLRLSEDPSQPDGGGPQTPTYAGTPGKPARARLAALPVAKAAPKPAEDADEYDDPLEAVKPSKLARKTAAAKAAPKPKTSIEPETDGPIEDEKGVDTIFSDADKPSQRPEPKPLAKPPLPAMENLPLNAAHPPAASPPPPPSSTGPSDGKRKSVADMNVDELNKYLNRK